MVVHYLDTSALVKRYVRERGAESVDLLLEKDRTCSTSVVTYAEIYAAIGRLVREGSMNQTASRTAAERFESDLRSAKLIEFSAMVREIIPALSRSVGLKGADLIQLASAILLTMQGAEVIFVSSDRSLLHAASSQGVAVLNPVIA